jgi:hypothetical protein
MFGGRDNEKGMDAGFRIAITAVIGLLIAKISRQAPPAYRAALVSICSALAYQYVL